MPKVGKNYKIKKNSLNLKITDDELFWYKHFAKARGITIQSFIRKTVLEFIKNHPESEYETKIENAA